MKTNDGNENDPTPDFKNERYRFFIKLLVSIGTIIYALVELVKIFKYKP